MSVYPAPSNVCNNELPLCLSKCFSFCLQEFAQFSENAGTGKSENAMSPPTGENEEIHLAFLLVNAFKYQVQKNTISYYNTLYMKLP